MACRGSACRGSAGDVVEAFEAFVVADFDTVPVDVVANKVELGKDVETLVMVKDMEMEETAQKS
jgi:hypothetical protein